MGMLTMLDIYTKLLRVLLLLSISTTLVNCSEDDEDQIDVSVIECTIERETAGECERFFSRKIYFAFSDNDTDKKNDTFQKDFVRAALNQISSETSLGEDYFSYEEIPEAELTPTLEPTDLVSLPKSFILIWPDDEFNDFAVNTIGDPPDNNGIIIVNSAFKKNFFMILKASCFEAQEDCNFVSSGLGLRALIARQLGMMVGIRPLENCIETPLEVNTMCSAFPNDSQWSDINRRSWSRNFNNNLELILNLPNFYNEFNDLEEVIKPRKYVGCIKNTLNQGQCLRWFDRNIFLVQPGDPTENSAFNQNRLQEVLTDIQSQTLLGPSYFSYQQISANVLYRGLNYPSFQAGQAASTYRSAMIIWSDTRFNTFYQEFFPVVWANPDSDKNVLVLPNPFYKRGFYIIFKKSCFEGGAGCNSLSEDGLKALVARSLGALVNLGASPSFCAQNPENTMCPQASNNQWSMVNRTNFITNFNNELEDRILNPQLYD